VRRASRGPGRLGHGGADDDVDIILRRRQTDQPAVASYDSRDDLALEEEDASGAIGLLCRTGHSLGGELGDEFARTVEDADRVSSEVADDAHECLLRHSAGIWTVQIQSLVETGLLYFKQKNKSKIQ
jgi:hypothetical protein